MAGTAEAVDRTHFRDLLGTTPNGKEIYLVRAPDAPLRRLAFGTGGQLPEHLQGGYSSIKMAQFAVEDYLDGLEKEAATKKTGRSTKK